MTSTYKIGISMASAGLLIVFIGSAGAKNINGPWKNDIRFAEAAAILNTDEIQLGRLALRNAYDYSVKELGRHVIDGHGKLEDELTGIAAQEHLTLPEAPDMETKVAMARLSGMSGPAFDRAYLQEMIQSNEEAIAAFQDEASNGSDSDLQNWARTSVPILQADLQFAKNDLIAIKTADADGITTRK